VLCGALPCCKFFEGGSFIMKNTKLILIGMLAVVLAFGLVFTSCEGPAGADGASLGGGGAGGGASGANPSDLATYGFGFGAPIHSQIGRDNQYPNAIYGNLELKGTTLSVNGTITVTGKERSVRFTLGSEAEANVKNADDIASAFTAAFQKGGFTGLTADVADAPDGTVDKKVIRITGIKENLSFQGPLVNKVFGASGSQIVGANATISGDYFSIGPSVYGQQDQWTVEILTAGDSNRVSNAATVTLGSKKVEFGTNTSVAAIGWELANEFSEYEDSRSEKAVPYYSVSFVPGYNAGALVFTNDKAEYLASASAFVPSISGFAGYGPYNYKIDIENYQEGRIAGPAVTGNEVKGLIKGSAENVAALVIDDSNDTVIITARAYWSSDPDDYDTYIDTTILRHGKGEQLKVNAINTNLTYRPYGSYDGFYEGSSYTITYSAAAAFKIEQDTNYGRPGLEVSGNAVGTWLDSSTSTLGDGAFKPVQEKARPDGWALWVQAGGSGFLPTKASKLILTFNGLTPTANSIKTVIIPAGSSSWTILDLINKALPASIDGYTKQLSGGNILFTKPSVATGNILSGISWDPSDL
jgi:hypothetical protein